MAIKRDAILKADDLKRLQVDVPEWGEGAFLYMREMSAAERIALPEITHEMINGERKAKPNIESIIAALFAVDESGSPIFTAEDADELKSKNPAPLDRMLDAWMRVNKMRKEDSEEAKKPSEPTASSGSPSA